MTDTKQPVIVWFRRDLRLADNPALLAAAQSGRPVIPLYIEDANTGNSWVFNGVVCQWFRLNAAALDNSLRSQFDSRLIYRRGSLTDELQRIAMETGASALFFNSVNEPAELEVEEVIQTICRQNEIKPYICQGNRLIDHGKVVSGTGDNYRVFGPYSRKFMQIYSHVPPQPKPESLESPTVWPNTTELLPDNNSDASGPATNWDPGEQAAQTALAAFVSTLLDRYATDRDLLIPVNTSKLSVYLNCGAISVRQIWDAVEQHSDPRSEESAASFLRQLIWREFSYCTLQSFPELPGQPCRTEFTGFPWTDSPEFLDCWKSGRTGYPVVDAAMRQLLIEGWMPGRARMVVASFLSKHLLVNWVEGERWFRGKLVDADLACNSFNWQWVAGCGLDAAPYFRIFNPITQGKKFDPEGEYVRRYIPEISALPTKHLHSPWTASPDVLQASGIVLGSTYPQPVVDHTHARNQALAAYHSLRNHS